MSGKITMKVVILTFIVSLLGLSLTGTIATSTTTAVANLTNVSGTGQDFASASSLIALFPLFWVILMIAIPVVAITLYYKGI